MEQPIFSFALLKSTRTLMAAVLIAMAMAMPLAGQDANEPGLKVLSATLARMAKTSETWSSEHIVLKPRHSGSLLLVVRVDGERVSEATTKNVKLTVGKRTIKIDTQYSIRSGGESRSYFIFLVPKDVTGVMTLTVADSAPVSFEPNGIIVDELVL